MANVNAPLGFKPVKYLNGALYTGAMTPYRIASGYNTSIYFGDVVKLVNTGYIQRAAAGDQMRGIFVAAIYKPANPSPMGQALRMPFWTASQATFQSADAVALIIDDPNVVFEAQMNAAMANGVSDAYGPTYNIVATAGSLVTGNSAEQLDYSTLNTTAQQFRAVGYVDRVDNDTAVTQAYTRVLVTPALHDFRVNTGI